MSNYIDTEINANQGNSGESSVAALLGRRGFTCNPSLKDRWGWDYYIEHVAPPIGHEKRKFEGLLQVKSTRIIDKTTVQIKLSALLRLIQSHSVAIIAFAKFDSDSDFPKSIWFTHVGKALMRNAHEASLIAAKNRTATHETWVSINHSDWLQVPTSESRSVDIYSKFQEYFGEFGPNYSLGKSDFFRGLNPIVKDTLVPVEKSIGDAYITFSHPSCPSVIHKTSAYMACIGPRFYHRLRSPFCEIEIDGNQVHPRFTLNVERPLSELDNILSALDIMEKEGWSLTISGAVCHHEELLMKLLIREDHMKPLSEIVQIYRRAFIEAGIEDYIVHFFQIGGALYGEPDLFRLIKFGGAIKSKETLPEDRRTLLLDMKHRYRDFMIVFWWKFEILTEGSIASGDLIKVSPGAFYRADAYDHTKKYSKENAFGGNGLPVDYAEDIYVRSADTMPLPSVSEYRNPDTIGVF